MTRTTVFLSLLWLCTPRSATAYLMVLQTYENMFKRADVVVIATPVETTSTTIDLPLEFDQPKEVTNLIKTVSTEFKVAYTLKGKLSGKTFDFLHLNRKDGKNALGAFGAVGTFFIDFDHANNSRKSYILFMKKRKDGSYCPAWRPMEGSRAIVPVAKDGEL